VTILFVKLQWVRVRNSAETDANKFAFFLITQNVVSQTDGVSAGLFLQQITIAVGWLRSCFGVC